MARLRRIVSSFAIVVACYWAYSLAAVPLIEPTAEERQVRERPDDAPLVSPEAQREQLKEWFSAGDWELTSPKVLETSQGILLVNEYHKLPDGRVELKPCTMIFMPEGKFENEAERRRKAVILRSPEGAILEFDSPFDLKSARIGKLVGGKLVGPISIRSDHKEPGPQDDLLIHTRDVELSQKLIWTDQPVDFQLGPNRGKGKRLQIQMTPQGEKQQGFRGMTSLELGQDVEMILQPGDNDMFPGSSRGTKARTSKTSQGNKTPVEVRCQGPFRFDFLRYVATFRDRVDVLRVNATGPSDQITCDLLSIYFSALPPPPPDPNNPAPKDAEPSSPNLQPSRLEAFGNPVIVRAPSSGVQARARQLEYDIRSGGATLRDEQEATIKQGHREIHSREVFMQPDSTGRLGQFRASGAGWLKGTLPDDETQAFEARWTQRLQLRPVDGIHLLSVEGAAHVHADGKGALDANEIHCWLHEAPTAGDANAKPAEGGKVALIPDRLMAVGSVKIDSPQLTGAVGKLQIWFEHRTPPPIAQLGQPALAPPPTPPVAPPPKPASQELPPPTTTGAVLHPSVPAQSVSAAGPARQPAASQSTAPVPPPVQRFNIEGEQLDVQARTLGQVVEIGEVVVLNKVRFTETKTRQPGEKPLLVTGQQLRFLQPTPEEALVTVTGQPAYVDARGTTLAASLIHLDRGKNTLHADGAGVMTLPSDRNLDGQPLAVPRVLEVTWQKLMHFDGSLAHFEQQVVARQETQILKTESLDVSFNRPIRFGVDGQPQTNDKEPRPQVEQVVCRQGAYLESRTLEGQRLVSIDRIQVVDLKLHQPTGNVAATGPGWVRSVRINNGQNGRNQDPQVAAAAPPGGGLVYIGVDFQRSLTGNMQRKELRFENNVKAIYGPVAVWEAQLDPDRPDQWGERGMLVQCEHMTVAEMGQAGPDTKFYELEATGNARVEGAHSNFVARADRLTYAQSKDLLILEGKGRNEAQLYRRNRPGEPPSKALARKIMYWPSTNKAEVEDAGFIDISNLPGTQSQKK